MSDCYTSALDNMICGGVGLSSGAEYALMDRESGCISTRLQAA